MTSPIWYGSGANLVRERQDLVRDRVTQPLAALEAGSGTCAVLIWYDTGTDLARADLTAPTLLAPLQAGGAAAFGGGAALIAAAPSVRDSACYVPDAACHVPDPWW